MNAAAITGRRKTSVEREGTLIDPIQPPGNLSGTGEADGTQEIEGEKRAAGRRAVRYPYVSHGLLK